MACVLDVFEKRRSVRRYSSRPLPKDALERCLEAARLAPSACNSQPWRFVVTDKSPLKERLALAAFGGVYSLNSFAKDAPVLITVISERPVALVRLGGFLKRVDYSLIDVGIACEHLVLQAAAEGIGTCWLGWFNERAVKQVLKIAGGIRVEAMVAMGYSADTAEPKRRKSLDEIRSYAG